MEAVAQGPVDHRVVARDIEGHARQEVQELVKDPWYGPEGDNRVDDDQDAERAYALLREQRSCGRKSAQENICKLFFS